MAEYFFIDSVYLFASPLGRVAAHALFGVGDHCRRIELFHHFSQRPVRLNGHVFT